MKSVLAIGSYVVSIQEQGKKNELARAGGKKLPNCIKNDQTALKITKIYRPGEVLIPNDMFLSMNMYEITTTLSPLTINYTHNAVNHFFLIKEAIELDKCFRENLDLRFVKAFRKHCKKHHLPKTRGINFKKYVLCKQTAQKVIEMHKNADAYMQELHTNLAHIMFDLSLELQGISVNFHDFSSNSLMNVAFTKNRFSFTKDKDFTSLSALGLVLQSSSAPVPLYEFMTTVSSIFIEKMRQFNVLYSYKQPNCR
jgi:hypothetical protein